MEVRARGGDARIELGPNEEVALTKNLFFTGTVNVDETTHGFADKVYDRAQLIELPIHRADLEQEMGNAPFKEDLLTVWDMLHAAAPFAFRTVAEIRSYVEKSGTLGVPWQEAFDEQLLQKVLPKFKGTDTELVTLLGEFKEFCEQRSFGLSAEKAATMIDAARVYGFISYF
jgi:hypothetical protein